MPLPPLNALRAFESAARCSSYVMAAAELGVTPAAISQQVRKLEDFYGKTLFLRMPNGVRLTDAGQAIFAGTAGALRALSDHTADMLGTKLRAQLVISCIESVAETWALPRLIDYTRLHPEFRFDLRVESDPIDFLRPDVDLRLCYGTQHYPDFALTLLCRDEVLPMCSPDWRARHPNLHADNPWAFEPQDLVETDWGADFGSGPSWRGWFAAAGIPAPLDDFGFRIGTSALALDMARAGLGVALGQRMLAQDDLSAGRLVTLSQVALPLGHPYALVTPRLKAERRGIGALARWLVQAAAVSPAA